MVKRYYTHLISTAAHLEMLGYQSILTIDTERDTPCWCFDNRDEVLPKANEFNEKFHRMLDEKNKIFGSYQ